jgi:hypothetical protein
MSGSYANRPIEVRSSIHTSMNYSIRTRVMELQLHFGSQRAQQRNTECDTSSCEGSPRLCVGLKRAWSCVLGVTHDARFFHFGRYNPCLLSRVSNVNDLVQVKNCPHGGG